MAGAIRIFTIPGEAVEGVRTQLGHRHSSLPERHPGGMRRVLDAADAVYADTM